MSKEPDKLAFVAEYEALCRRYGVEIECDCWGGSPEIVVSDVGLEERLGWLRHQIGFYDANSTDLPVSSLACKSGKDS